MIDPVYRLIGLAQKANRILSGSERLAESIKSGRGRHLVIAADSPDKTKERYAQVARQAGVEIRIYGTKEELGQSMGKGIRSAVLITDNGFGEAVFKKIDNQTKMKE